VQLQKQNADAPSLKTTIIAFDKHENATMFACMLESHKSHTKSYPTTCTGDINTLFELHGDLTLPEYPSELQIHPWNLYDLNSYCMRNIIDLLHLKKIEKTNNNTYTINGELIHIEPDITYQVKVYDKLFYSK